MKLQPCQRLQRGAAADALILVKDNGVAVHIHAGQGDDLIVELTGVLCRRRTAVALESQLVHLLTGDAVAGGYILRRQAHGHILLLPLAQQVGIEGIADIQIHRAGGHGLHAAGHHYIRHAAGDLARRQCNGL